MNISLESAGVNRELVSMPQGTRTKWKEIKCVHRTKAWKRKGKVHLPQMSLRTYMGCKRLALPMVDLLVHSSLVSSATKELWHGFSPQKAQGLARPPRQAALPRQKMQGWQGHQGKQHCRGRRCRVGRATKPSSTAVAEGAGLARPPSQAALSWQKVQGL